MVSYFASIITARLIMLAAREIITIIGTYYSVSILNPVNSVANLRTESMNLDLEMRRNSESPGRPAGHSELVPSMCRCRRQPSVHLARRACVNARRSPIRCVFRPRNPRFVIISGSSQPLHLIRHRDGAVDRHSHAHRRRRILCLCSLINSIFTN